MNAVQEKETDRRAREARAELLVGVTDEQRREVLRQLVHDRTMAFAASAVGVGGDVVAAIAMEAGWPNVLKLRQTWTSMQRGHEAEQRPAVVRGEVAAPRATPLRPVPPPPPKPVLGPAVAPPQQLRPVPKPAAQVVQPARAVAPVREPAPSPASALAGASREHLRSCSTCRKRFQMDRPGLSMAERIEQAHPEAVEPPEVPDDVAENPAAYQARMIEWARAEVLR